MRDVLLESIAPVRASDLSNLTIPGFPRDVYVSPEDAGGARDGQLVVVRLRSWLPENPDPEGEIVEILGHPDDPGVDTLSIVKEYDLPIEFPPNVLEAAEEFSDRIPARRKSKTGRTSVISICVTIDPEDARDHDDAVSLEDRPGRRIPSGRAHCRRRPLRQRRRPAGP